MKEIIRRHGIAEQTFIAGSQVRRHGGFERGDCASFCRRILRKKLLAELDNTTLKDFISRKSEASRSECCIAHDVGVWTVAALLLWPALDLDFAKPLKRMTLDLRERIIEFAAERHRFDYWRLPFRCAGKAGRSTQDGIVLP